MILDKFITHGREHRKPYQGEKVVEKSCQNHGSCEWCKRNRTHKNNKRELKQAQELEEYNG